MRYRAEITKWLDDGNVDTQGVEGEAAPVAAWLRAIADQLDPPRRPTRGLVPAPDRAIAAHLADLPSAPRVVR